MELHGYFGAGFLGGAGAVEDDVAVAGDAVGHVGKLSWADADRSRQHARVWQVVEWVAEVDDEGLHGAVELRTVEHLLEVGGFEAEFADLGQEAALLDDSPDEEAGDHEDKYGSGEVGEQGKESLAALGDVAEEAAGEEERERPEEGSGEVVEQEAGIGHAGLAGDGSGDGGEARDELGEEEGFGAAAVEVALCLGDAG